MFSLNRYTVTHTLNLTGALVPFCIIAAALFFLSGCATYEGRVLSNDETKDSATASPKSRISLSIVADAQTMGRQLIINKNIYKVSPVIIEGFGKYIGHYIEKVQVVPESEVRQSSCDMSFYPRFSTSLDYSTLKMELQGNLVDCKTGVIRENIIINEQTDLERALIEKVGEHTIDFAVSIATDHTVSKMLRKLAITTAARISSLAQANSLHIPRAAPSPAPPEILPPSYTASHKPSHLKISIISPKVQRGLKVIERNNLLRISGVVSGDNPIEELGINGSAVTLDTGGYFEKAVTLSAGENRFVITARDIRGNLANEHLTAHYDTARSSNLAIQQETSRKGRKLHALVIGINSYQVLPKLATAVNDAREIARILREHYNYNVRLITDVHATHDGIMKELNALRSVLKPDDKLIIYYAGHGVLDKTTDSSYWLPVDAENNDDTKWIDSRRISDQLKRMTSRQILVIADSCYSGTLSRQVHLNMAGSESRENYLNRLQEKPSRILIASGGNEPVSDSGWSGHSVFAATLIKILTNPTQNTFVASELLYSNLREAVTGRSEQTPEYKYIRNSGHESGDFVFEKVR